MNSSRPTREELLVEHAKLVARRSTCSRLQVGAVVSRDGRILVTGYNGAPAGMPHCNHACDCGIWREGESDQSHGRGCTALNPCTVSVHAEANAVAYAARWGISLEGSRLTSTDTPCLACAQLIINSGITHVTSCRDYRDRSGELLLIQAGIKVSSMAHSGLV